MPKPQQAILRGDFNLGGEQAEADPLLSESFYETADYTAIKSFDDAHSFIVARTGAGKTAAFAHLEKEEPNQVVRISPQDLSLPYLTGLQVLADLDALDVHLDSIFVALWKHVFIVELLRHRYDMTSPAAKQNILVSLREMLSRDPAKQAALDYLSEFGEKFWCETDERVREIVDKFERSILAKNEASVSTPEQSISLGIEGSTEGTEGKEIRRDLRIRFQRVVNETQLPRLNKMMKVLDEDIFDTGQQTTYVIVDDLDRDWVDERLANDLIRCLLRTVLDFQYLRNVKFLIALRTNILESIDFGHSGGQEEKFRSLVKDLQWRRNDLENMLDERVRAASRHANFDVELTLEELLPADARAGKSALDYVLERTLMRPRDAISYLNMAIDMSRGESRLSWESIEKTELAYSRNRLLALRDEWKMSYPGVERVFEEFRGSPWVLSRDQLTQILDETVLLMADHTFPGVDWMTDMGQSVWSGSHTPEEWPYMYGRLVRFLYSIGFLCGIASGDEIVTNESDPYWMEGTDNLHSDARFAIHPAFRAALEVSN